jgi:hypothetical protein
VWGRGPNSRGRDHHRGGSEMRRRLLVLMCVLILGVLVACVARVYYGSRYVYAWPYNTRRHTYAAALGDLDGDGDADAYLANGANEGIAPDTVWLNEGSGVFYGGAAQSLEAETHHVALGDVDGDGDLDAATGWTGVALNDGWGRFSYPQWGSSFARDSGAYAYFPALGDLDGDGDLDLVLGGCCGAQSHTPGREFVRYSFNVVLLNDGDGRFRDTGQRLGVSGTGGIALGDLDGDGDLDVFDANSGSLVEGTGQPERNQPNMVWLNDGRGHFTDSGQRLGREESHAVALGDLDGDGDLDAFVGNRGPDRAWLNDGLARFSAGGQALKDGDTRLVQLGDVDGDGDLDAYSAGRGFGVIWRNRGGVQGGTAGGFERLQRVGHSIWFASTLGDVDGDGDLDVFVGRIDGAPRVWMNDGRGRFTERRVPHTREKD